jgi:hypothetical protein
MNTTFTTVTLVHETCYKCNVTFGLNSEQRDRLKRTHNDFYCPNGHAQHFVGKSDVEKLQEEQLRLNQIITQEREAKEHYQLKYAGKERELVATKGHLTRKRNELHRVKNGVCPCCNRNFANLRNHMENKHPEFQKNDN